jgi:putative transposase
LHENRKHFFGEIKDNQMNLSHVGVMAHVLWHEIPNHAKFVELGDFVVMPNHIHGILILDTPTNVNNAIDVNDNTGLRNEIAPTTKQTYDPTSDKPANLGHHRFQNIGKNTVSSIIGSYKSAVTKYANRLGFVNGWQERFNDRIIRNDTAYQRISNYIITNLVNWKDDKFYLI